jgi:RNA polymerase sigma factor (sigma-70 family)
MMQNLRSDTELLDALKQGSRHRDEALQQIYGNTKLKRSVMAYVMAHNGNEQDADDVFQDSLILFDRQIREGKFQGQSSLTTYFIGIAKWRWVSLQRKWGRNIELKPEKHDQKIESVEARAIENEKRDLIDEVLSKIGKRCQTILKLYKLSYSMEEIAAEMDLSSPALAKKNAYECRKKFKDFVVQHPEYQSIIST